MGEQPFESIEAFYAADERRRTSGEMDFGCWWWDGDPGHSGCWSVSVVQATGEVYAQRRRIVVGGGEPVLLLGHVEAVGTVERGGRDFPAVYAEAEQLLEDWAEICGTARSFEWVRRRLGSAPQITYRVRATLGGDHVHVVMWAGTNPGARGRCGELILRSAEWSVLRGALVKGLGQLLELDLDPALALEQAAPA